MIAAQRLHPAPIRGARWLAGVLIVLGVSVAPNLVHAQLVSTDLVGAETATRAEVTLTLTWSQPVRLRVTMSGLNVHVQSDAPLNHTGFATLYKRLHPWLASVQLGYDSVMLRMKPGVTAARRIGATSLGLTFRRPNVAPKRRLYDPGAARRRLQLLKASLLWSTGDAWAASQLLQKMRSARPGDTDLLAAQAVVETRLGRWRRASEALHDARTRQGVRSRGDLPVRGSVQAPYVDLAFRSDQQSDGQERLGVELGGHAFVAAGLRLLGRYTFANLGEQQAHRGKMGLRQDLRSGSYISAHATVAEDRERHIGGAATVSLWDTHGETVIEGNWKEANWALPALVNVQATRSAIGVRRTLRSLTGLGRPISGDVSLSISAHLERWQSEPDNPDMDVLGPAGRRAEEITDLFAAATLRYVSWRSQPRIWAAYSILHLQRLGDTPAATTLGPDVLDPLFAQSHIHSLNAGLRLQVWRWLELTGHGGYGLRVGGADAVQFGAGVSWTPPDGFRLSVTFDRGFQATTYGVSTTRLVARAAIVF